MTMNPNSVQALTLHAPHAAVLLKDIPEFTYPDFSDFLCRRLTEDYVHCVLYSAFPDEQGYLFLCMLANDRDHTVEILSHRTESSVKTLESLTPLCSPLHGFEREIHENTGIIFEGHPWLKGIRFPFNRKDRTKTMDTYPFYEITGGELHEIGVGPVHAGVIEPGHFRFICNGEKVLHLEIQLGYQHRGIEQLMVESAGLKRSLLAETIAGDTAIGHSIAHARLMEALRATPVPERLQLERAIALELERIAMHIGDTAALSMDVAYQLGQVVNESLRTIVINTTQLWCGNRFGKGLVRPGGTHYPLQKNIAGDIRANLKAVFERFIPMSDKLFSMPSVLGRFDGIGVVSTDQLRSIGAVGMAARMGGLNRDIRYSHPEPLITPEDPEPVILQGGDVLSRALLRRKEAERSARMIHLLLDHHQETEPVKANPVYDAEIQADSLAFSLSEGWRGEICHAAITGKQGEILHYKIKDPSFHNWMALALAVRNQEISDFPVCNKSFNLSYCGNDL